ncbi:MAG: carbonic anhydrase [Gammaproteobacteria bacterium]|nr:carbonic anhydrase [Gammaproteobacteria bacterium]
MQKSFAKILKGYKSFRNKYTRGNRSIMRNLSEHGQHPGIMVIACCDSRVDPALILQCDPGDLFVVRNVANIVPPYEKDELHHGVSAALEFAVCHLKVKHLILLGHSQCGGIKTLLSDKPVVPNDFITNWVSIVDSEDHRHYDPDQYAKFALHKSHANCLTFPWITQKIENKELSIHLWFFDIKSGEIITYSAENNQYNPLDQATAAGIRAQGR